MRIIDNAFLEPYIGQVSWVIDKDSTDEVVILKIPRQGHLVTYMPTNIDSRLIEVRFVTVWGLSKLQGFAIGNQAYVTSGSTIFGKDLGPTTHTVQRFG